MTNWMIWFLIAGVLVVLEMCTGTFYMLMLGLCFGAGGVAALFSDNFSHQLMAACAVGLITVYVLYRKKMKTSSAFNPTKDPNMHFDIGQKVVVDKWTVIAGGPPKARVSYRGALWDAELAPDSKLGESGEPEAGTYIIRAIRGQCLILDNQPQ